MVKYLKYIFLVLLIHTSCNAAKVIENLYCNVTDDGNTTLTAKYSPSVKIVPEFKDNLITGSWVKITNYTTKCIDTKNKIYNITFKNPSTTYYGYYRIVSHSKTCDDEQDDDHCDDKQ